MSETEAQSRRSSFEVEDIHDVLCNDELRLKFMKYLRKRLAEESLLFYESVIKFETLLEDKQRQKVGSKIVDKFVKEEAIYCINISSAQRIFLCSLKVFEEDSFDDAKSTIIGLLSSNFFYSFANSLKNEETDEGTESLASLESLDNMERIMGSLNSRDEPLLGDDCECHETATAICCKKQRDVIENHLHKAGLLTIKKWRKSMSERLLDRIEQGEEKPHTKAPMTKFKRVIKRIFHKKKHHGKKNTFWDDFEPEI